MLKCDIKINYGGHDNSGIQFADQENIIIVSHIFQIQPRAKMKLLPVFGRHLEFRNKAINSKGWHGER